MGKLPKNIQLRYRVIDRLLRDYDTVKTTMIIDKIFERHDISVGKTTIQKDLRNMMMDYHAPIEYDNVNDVMMECFSFFQYYNNNYRPIYHLEKFIFYLINRIHGFQYST